MAITLGGQPCLDPLDLWQQFIDADPPLPLEPSWWGVANSFRCPLGAEPGRGVVLMRRGDYESLDTNTPLDLVWTDSDGGQVTCAELVVVRSWAIAPGASEDEDTPLAVELADQRHVWRWRIVDRAYNLRVFPAGAYLQPTLNGGTPWTWLQLLTDLWNAHGLLGNFPGLVNNDGSAWTPDGTPENFAFWARPALEALDQVVTRLGCALHLNPTTGVLRIVRLGQDLTANQRAAGQSLDPDRVWDDYPDEPALATLPALVTVRFRKNPRPVDGSSPYYLVTVADTADVTGREAASAALLDDDLQAVMEAGAATNAVAMTSRANERAADYFRRRARFNARDRAVYEGARDEALDTLLGSGQFAEASVEDRGQGMKTTLVARPDDTMERWRLQRPPDDPDTWVECGDFVNVVGDWSVYSGTVQLPAATPGVWHTQPNAAGCYLVDANSVPLVKNVRYKATEAGIYQADGLPVYMTWQPVGGCLTFGGLDLTTLPGYDATQVQALGHLMGGLGSSGSAGPPACLQWLTASQNCGSSGGGGSGGGGGNPSSLGPNYPTAETTDSTGTVCAWSNTSFLNAADGRCASIALPRGGATSCGLIATGFGFQVPLLATILGFRAEIYRYASGSNILLGSPDVLYDATLKLYVAGAPVGSNYASSSIWPTAPGLATYGGAGDTWGATVFPSDVNDPGFGLYLAVHRQAGMGASQPTRAADVDYIRLTVYYQ